MNFFPYKIEPDIWIKDYSNHYEHVVVHIDNLLIVSKDPQIITKTLLEVHKFKLKGTRIVNYHLGYNFFRDDNEILYFSPRKCIEKIANSFETILGISQMLRSIYLLKKETTWN